MSMIGNLVAVSPEQLQSFMADPGLIVPFLYPDEGGAEPAVGQGGHGFYS